MSVDNQALPHWDMTVFYPGLDAQSFEADFGRLMKDIDELEAYFDERAIGMQEPGEVDSTLVADLEEAIRRLNQIFELSMTIDAYIFSFIATDSRNDQAQARQSQLEQKQAQLGQLTKRFIAWIGGMQVEAAIEASELGRQHAFFLRQAKREAEHLMPTALEALASDLRLTGSRAWSKLHGDVSSQITVELELDGELKELPMSAVRNLSHEPSREVRRRAYEAELNTWKAWRVPLAAAMNSIKGEVNALSRRRGWDSPLDYSLFQNRIDRGTLQAMMQAAKESLPDFRRYLKVKARALGLEQLSWYDIFAPLDGESGQWEFDRAMDFILAQFGRYSERLERLAGRAFDERWIDAEPRPGKRDGAFCMMVKDDQSRILANYKPSYDGVSTLAHELGHAYHNLNLASRTMLQRETPMTLAETASTFCETIIQKAALRQLEAEAQIQILEAALMDACQKVVDISGRFSFEQSVFERRQDRELSPDELCELMLEAQRDTYADGLAAEDLHAYMWAVKPHYYSGGLSFYNYPYTFGLLFGLGLYARYQDEPEAFRPGYDDLLAGTGMGWAAELANRFGIDIQTPDFWRASLDVIRADINRFESLVGAGQDESQSG